MGIQSVSEAGGKSFNRIVPKKRLREAVSSIHGFKTILPPIYDFILDNPYESDKDRLENLRFMLNIPQPRVFQQFSLVPFPGTDLFKRMCKDELIVDIMKEIYMKSYSYPRRNYINLLFFLANINIPLALLRFMSSTPMTFLFNNRISRAAFQMMPYSAVRWMARALIHSEFWENNKEVYS
jgi:hypothetical protein